MIILEFLMYLTRWNLQQRFCRMTFCIGVNCPSPRLNSGGRRCTTHRAKTSGVKATEHNARRPSTADICIGWAAQYNAQPFLQLAKFTLLGETRIVLESFVAQPQGNTQLLLWARFVFRHILLIKFLARNAIFNCVFFRDEVLKLICLPICVNVTNLISFVSSEVMRCYRINVLTILME